MMTIGGYNNLRLINRDAETEIYAGTSTLDHEHVVLRLHRREKLTRDHLANYQSEYALLSNLDSSHVCKVIELLEHDGVPVLVLKNTSGPNLENYLRDYRPVHAECIKIALSITQGLDYIHGQNISHRNLIPSNVVIDPISCHATLYGFDIATRLNGTIDHKADYYSLGVLLYELITGKPAFQIEDPLHSIYNEIVAIPASPSSVNSEVPIELSNVVMKLLEKIPENQYPSISTIQQDLSACLDRLKNSNHAVFPFTVATNDIPLVVTATQTLSKEVVLEDLLKRLTQLALENAGAHSAHLLLNQSGAMRLKIITSFNGANIEHNLTEQSLDDLTSLPLSIVRHVARTQKNLVLHAGHAEGGFTQDEYILRNKPKSILCMPIFSKANLTGILYLENSQTAYAFTEKRVTLLKLLTSQSAIAIDNAMLYQQLNAYQNKYLSLYQNAFEGIFELNAEGWITDINPAAAELLGYEEPDDILSRTELNFKSVFFQSKEIPKLQRTLLKNQRVLGYETRLRKLNGEPFWVDLSAQLVYDSSEKISHIEGFFIDVTERKLRQKAERAKRLAEAATKAKSDFLANMSHEIRTPMNAIMGYTDLALVTSLTQQQANYIETIKNSSTHLLRLINDVLDISKIESGKIELQNIPFSLSELLDDLKQLFQLSAKESGLKLVFTEYPDETQFEGDPVRLGQVLINLINNAIKFTDAGTILIHVSCENIVGLRAQLNFSVKDTGIGIETTSLDSIFESFTQEGPTEKQEAGTGLGLAISKQLVDMMNGEIKVESTLGQGSTFSFSIPIGITESSATDENIKPFLVTSTANSSSRAGLIEGMSILMVEDNVINQRLASEVLRNAGAKVVLANNGEEALSFLKPGKFDLVLMDMMMPVMGGLEATKRIRAQEEYRSLPVIALSAGVLQSQLDEALENGFNHYLTKPINFDALINLLADINSKILFGESSIAMQTSVEPNAPSLQPSTTVRSIADQKDWANENDEPDRFAVALENHNDDPEFLSSLLGEFLKFYSNAGQELEDFINSTDQQEQAVRLAHNLASVAGSFGAIDLLGFSRELEKCLLANDTKAIDHLADLKEALKIFVEEIHQFRSKH